MAAFTRQDVIDTLMDPALNRILIYAEGLWINRTSFNYVLSNIMLGRISVEEGNQTIALYYSAKNKIVTQLGTSPPNFHARALLLHECTHALMDIHKFHTRTLTNELLCYITQHLYLLLKIPGYNITVNKALDPVSQASLWETFYHSVLEYAKRGLSGLMVIDTNHWEFKSLQNHLWSLNIYQHLQYAAVSKGNG